MERYDEGRRGQGNRINPAILGLGLCIPFAATGLPALALLPVLAAAPRAVEWAGRKSTFDEGGIRFDRWCGLEHGYLEFARIARARIDDACVTAEDAVGEVIETWILRDLETRARLYVSVTERVAARELDAPKELQRDGRNLDDWLSSLDTMNAGGPYRGRSFDLEQARKLVANPNARVDARAAAAHLLLRTGNPSLIEEVSSRLGSESPPLVLAVASLALPSLVALAAPVVRYLDRPDRSEWKSRMR